MKYFILFIIYIAVFVALFFILSLFGMLWTNYNTVISDPNWFLTYTVFIGWWASLIVTIDYYEQVIEE